MGKKRKAQGTAYSIGQKIPVADKAKRNAVFQRLDASGDGELDLKEVMRAVRLLFADCDLQEQLSAAFHCADQSGDGNIQMSEFRSLLRLLSFFNTRWAQFQELRAQHTQGGK